jgi:hypothetical protein
MQFETSCAGAARRYALKPRNGPLGAEYGHTVNNVSNPSRDGNTVVVCIAPNKQFLAAWAFEDVKDVLAQGETESVERVVNEAAPRAPAAPPGVVSACRHTFKESFYA